MNFHESITGEDDISIYNNNGTTKHLLNSNVIGNNALKLYMYARCYQELIPLVKINMEILKFCIC